MRGTLQRPVGDAERPGACLPGAGADRHAQSQSVEVRTLSGPLLPSSARPAAQASAICSSGYSSPRRRSAPHLVRHRSQRNRERKGRRVLRLRADQLIWKRPSERRADEFDDFVAARPSRSAKATEPVPMTTAVVTALLDRTREDTRYPRWRPSVSPDDGSGHRKCGGDRHPGKHRRQRRRHPTSQKSPPRAEFQHGGEIGRKLPFAIAQAVDHACHDREEGDDRDQHDLGRRPDPQPQEQQGCDRDSGRPATAE